MNMPPRHRSIDVAPAAASLLMALIVTFLIAAAPSTRRGEGAKATTTPTTPTVQAVRGLAIIDSSFQPDDAFFVAAQERARELADALELPRDANVSNWLLLEGYPNGLTIRVALDSAFTSPPPVAGEIADGLVEFTRDYVMKQHQEAVRTFETSIEAAERRSAEAHQKLARMRQELREVSGRSDVSRATLSSALSSIDDEVQKLRLEMLAKQSRRKALEEEIARAAARIEQRVESDPIAAELAKVVEAREQSAQRIRQLSQSGQASASELSDAIASAAEARAKLLQQKRDAAAAAGGSALESFNRELMTLSIDAREIEAKLDYLQDRLPRLREAVERLDEYAGAEQEQRQAGQQLMKTQEIARDMQLNRKTREPKVLVKESHNFPLAEQ